MNAPDASLIPDYFFYDEVATRLRVSVKTVRREVSRGNMSCFHVGGQCCILVSEVHDYIQRQIAKGKGKPPCKNT
jgi:excisionase family DNA binding protein